MDPRPKNLQGHLRDVSLPDLLQNLQHTRATGGLILTWKAQKKTIFLKNGQIVFASSNQFEDRLGNILVRSGKLTREQAEAALKFKEACKKRYGGTLVELGYLTPKELFEGLKAQVREIIVSLFHWEEGDFEFSPGILPEEVISLVLDPVSLITEIIARLQEESNRME